MFLLAFSAYCQDSETRAPRRSEVTLRLYCGFPYGPAVTAGARVNDNLTIGIMAGYGSTYVDAAPGTIYSATIGMYMRYYIHLDKKDVTALYSDVIAGARRIYRVAGEGPSILVSPGDVYFNLDWQPGLRIRFYKNIHVFLGPTIGRASVGFHIGLGF